MDRDRWKDHIGERWSRERPLWPDAPPGPGDWHELERTDGLRILVDFTQAQLAADEHPILERHPVLGLRAAPLACYDRHLLVEVLLRTEEGDGVLAFTYGLSGVRTLDYSSAPVLALNRSSGPPATTPAAVVAYLHLFNGFLAANEPPQRFRIVTTATDVPFLPAERPDEYRELSAALYRILQSPRVLAVTDAEPRGVPAEQVPAGDPIPAWIVSAHVLYGDRLFEADYRLERGGAIEMTDDRPCFENLPVRRERFMGAIRLP